MALGRSAKKQANTNNSKKLKRFLSNKSEDFWFCIALIALIVGITVSLTYSMKNSQEAFVKSDYFISINNLLYKVQQENGTALFITFKPKFIRRGKTTQELLSETFLTARNHSRTPNIDYEILREGKGEVLLQLKLSN